MAGKLVNKISDLHGLIFSIGIGFGGLSCAQSQNSAQTEFQDSQHYDYIDTIKTQNDLEKFYNWMDSIFLSNGEIKKDEPNYLKDLRYKFSENDLKRYNFWIDSTLNESKRQKKNAILINKSEYALYLIKSGRIACKYPIELGRNPFDDKQRLGDMCTPEGLYKVDVKKDQGQTVFYKAFLLDYPNAEDKLKVKTGGSIEVHGSGSGSSPEYGGYNWTLGCIALSNEDIDEIFPFINAKDRITIVRYTDKDLDKILLDSLTDKEH